MDEEKSTAHKTSLLIKVPSAKSNGDGEKEPSSPSNNARDQLEEMSSILLSALKIIVMGSVVEDDISEDFFASYDNYHKISEKLNSLKLLSKDIPLNEEGFVKNPVDCWMKMIIVIFTALFSFPGNSDIHCDVLTSEDSKNEKDNNIIGIYFSTVLKVDIYDWNEYKVDVFLPNKDGERILFIVDDEPKLYTLNVP